jgi:hypothetical protein
MICPVIDKPISCEICAVIHCLCARNVSAAEIHSKLCTLYGQKGMSKGTVRQWCTMFKNGRTNVHDEEQRGLPVICSE